MSISSSVQEENKEEDEEEEDEGDDEAFGDIDQAEVNKTWIKGLGVNYPL